MAESVDQRGTTLWSLTRDAFTEARGNLGEAERVLVEWLQRDDPPFALLREEALRAVAKERLLMFASGERRNIWNGNRAHSSFDREMPEPLVSEHVPNSSESPTPRVIELATESPVPAATSTPGPRTAWSPNEKLADEMMSCARQTMLDYPIRGMGRLGDLTMNQVRRAAMEFRRVRRDSTIMEIFLGLVAEGRPGYRIVAQEYTAAQLDEIKERSLLLAKSVRLSQ